MVPPWNQQSEPALTPLSTTPASQARRNTASSPWTRHTASRFAAEPPITHTTSCSRTALSMSSMFGIGNRCSGVRSKPATRAASLILDAKCSASPIAVPTYMTRGRRPSTRASSTAWWTSGPNSTRVRSPTR